MGAGKGPWDARLCPPPVSPDTSGIPVEDERLQKVTEWVSKQEDPIDGELLPDASQTAKELLAKGLFKDKFTAALLNGVEPEDDGGVGTPFESEGNGDCLLNSVAALFANEGGRGVRSAVKTMAVKLRFSVDGHFGVWYNYTSDVRKRLEKNGWHVVPDVDNNWHVGSSKCARLMFLAQLRSIAKPGAWLQQFVFPILATVAQSPLDDWWMCFGLPPNSKNRLQGFGAAYSSIQRCPRTRAHNTFDRLQVSTAHVEPLVTLRCSWLPFKTPARRLQSRDLVLLERVSMRHVTRADCLSVGTGALFCSSWASTTRIAAAFWGRVCCGLSVILTDADLAMTAAIASCWPGTLHLHCLWHVFKNVLKNCSSSFANNDDKTDMMRCFRNAAYAATPEVFGTQVARLEQLVAGKKCEGYIANLIKRREEALIVRSMGSPATSQQDDCHKDCEVDEAQSYDAELVSSGRVEENGDPLPLHEHDLAKIRSLRLKLNILHVAPPDTDLEGDQLAGEAAVDNTMWARTLLSAFLDLIEDIPIELVVAVRYKWTANRPSHLVVFGHHNFHLCSCLQLLRCGLPCRDYFAVLVNLIGRTGESDEMAFTHTFNGSCVHNRWRRRKDGKDLPWSISSVLSSSGHGVGWDGHDEVRDENYWGPTCDEAVDGIHPTGPGRAAQDTSASDKRRAYDGEERGACRYNERGGDGRMNPFATTPLLSVDKNIVTLPVPQVFRRKSHCKRGLVSAKRPRSQRKSERGDTRHTVPDASNTRAGSSTAVQICECAPHTEDRTHTQTPAGAMKTKFFALLATFLPRTIMATAAAAAAAAAAAVSAAALRPEPEVEVTGGCTPQELLPQAYRLGRDAANKAGFEYSLPKVDCVVKRRESRGTFTPPGKAQAHEVAGDGDRAYHALLKDLQASLGQTNMRVPRMSDGVKSALKRSIISHILGPSASQAVMTTLLSTEQTRRARALQCTETFRMQRYELNTPEPADKGVMTYGWLDSIVQEKLRTEWLDLCWLSLIPEMYGVDIAVWEPTGRGQLVPLYKKNMWGLFLFDKKIKHKRTAKSDGGSKKKQGPSRESKGKSGGGGAAGSTGGGNYDSDGSIGDEGTDWTYLGCRGALPSLTRSQQLLRRKLNKIAEPAYKAAFKRTSIMKAKAEKVCSVSRVPLVIMCDCASVRACL
ncbi:unnamed protein product [Ectocarpus sp. CCAP 1310/34]|nr:unnamed protein product [Ectocarpus sp. CCAP 1310/34]